MGIILKCLKSVAILIKIIDENGWFVYDFSFLSGYD